MQTFGLQGSLQPHLKDLIHIYFEPAAQDFSQALIHIHIVM